MGDSIRVFHVGSSKAKLDLVSSVFEEEAQVFEIISLLTRSDLDQALKVGIPQLLISDFNALGFAGIDTLCFLQKAVPGVPMVVLTGCGNEELAVQALKMGVMDYVVQNHENIRKLARSLPEDLSRLKERPDNEQTEAALCASEERFRAVFDSAVDSIFIKDRNLRYTQINSSMEQLFNLPASDLLGKSDRDLFGLEAALHIEAVDNRILAGETIEEEHTKPVNGVDTTFHTIKVPMYSKSGAIVGICGIARDVTERKLAAAERDRLNHAIEQVSESVIITDSRGRIQYANPAFQRITGYTMAEMAQEDRNFLKWGEYPREFYDEMWEKLTSGETWQGQLLNHKKDGTLLIEMATISPVFNESGEIVNYVAAKHDITESLEKERALIQTQKVDSIGRLAGGIAHDLNNLLTPILGFSELLISETSPDDPQWKSVNGIQRSGLRARDLVKQLLAFSRQQTLNYKPMFLHQAVEEFQDLLRRTIREDIEIRIEYQPDIPTIRADIGQIELVLMNLAINAEDAMPGKGRLTIDISQAEVDETEAKLIGLRPGSFVLLVFSDTGIGMDKETLQFVFEPFYSTKGENGTGLGLATVYGIIKQHDGSIIVRSEPGKGSEFHIFLPVLGEALLEDEEPPKARGAKGTGTILLVEDNEDVLELAQTVIESHGYKALLARNGEEGLAVLKESGNQVDLLLTDVVMPGLDGPELYSLAKDFLPNLKVLYMSGYAGDAVINRGVHSVETALLQKPFTNEDLVAKVCEILDCD